jgi:hypothetical protein
MQFNGEMDLQILAKLNGIASSGEEAAPLSSRAFDSNGDGRPDLYLVDADGDGRVNSVVRALDSNGDGIDDTLIQYDEDGAMQAVGFVDAATGELNITVEPGDFDAILGSFGPGDLGPPETLLFTSFDDPYIRDSYGSFGDYVPDAVPDPEIIEDFTVVEVSEEDAAALEHQDAPGGAEPAQNGNSEAEPPEVAPRIVEIEDRSGGDASSLWAKVDRDADGLADYDSQLLKTSTGDYYGDIDKDGYSENVATDLDLDGRIDTVDTTGHGSSQDTVDAAQIVEPASDHLADHGPGDEGPIAAGPTDDGGVVAAGYDSSADASLEYDSGAPADAPGDDSA